MTCLQLTELLAEIAAQDQLSIDATTATVLEGLSITIDNVKTSSLSANYVNCLYNRTGSGQRFWFNMSRYGINEYTPFGASAGGLLSQRHTTKPAQ
jgi:hypothetical protein